MRLLFESASVSKAFLLQGHPWKCWLLAASLKHVLTSGVGSTAASFLPQFFFFYIYSLFFLIKINLLMIFPVIVRGDFLLLLFLYCKLPQLPSQSVLVRTLFCSWYEPEYPLASTLNLPLTNMKGKKLTI